MFPLLGQLTPGVLDAPPSESKQWPALFCKGMEKNALAMSIVAYDLTALNSNSYWTSNMPGTAALRGGVTLLRPR